MSKRTRFTLRFAPQVIGHLDLIEMLLPVEATTTVPFELSVPALLFAAAVTLGTGLLFGLFPALHSTRPAAFTFSYTTRAGVFITP